MARVVYAEHIDSIHGKICRKNPSGAIYRKMYGKNFMSHIHNPFTGPATEAQEAQKQRFKTATANTKLILNDAAQLAPYKEAWRKNPGKYVTLRGYIFAQEMAKLMV